MVFDYMLSDFKVLTEKKHIVVYLFGTAKTHAGKKQTLKLLL